LVEERMPSSPSWSPWLLVRSLLLNSVPLYGVFVAGWSWGTILVLFWCENLLGGLFTTLLVLISRPFAWKRRARKKSRGEPSFANDFLWPFLGGNLGIGLWLAFILGLWLAKEPGAAVQLPALQKGLKVTVLLLLGGFFVDLHGIRDRPSSWIRRKTDDADAWMAVVLYSIFFGIFAFLAFKTGKALFWVFLCIKLMAEVGAAFSPQTTLAEMPSWGPWLIHKLRPRLNIEPELRQVRERAEQRALEDQPVMPADRVVVPAVPARPPARRKRSPRPNRHSGRLRPPQ
jgi:hypothetical protein